MDKSYSIDFSAEEYDMIAQYMRQIDAITMQTAILNAISIALDNDGTNI